MIVVSRGNDLRHQLGRVIDGGNPATAHARAVAGCDRGGCRTAGRRGTDVTAMAEPGFWCAEVVDEQRGHNANSRRRWKIGAVVDRNFVRSSALCGLWRELSHTGCRGSR